MTNPDTEHAFSSGGMADPHSMTLRDWFAGQALTGLLAGRSQGVEFTCGDAATSAYLVADAMLAERLKTYPKED